MKRNKLTSTFLKTLIHAFVVFTLGMTAPLATAQNDDNGTIELDSVQVLQWIQKGSSFFYTHSDSSLYYMNQALFLARKIHFEYGIGLALLNMSESYRLVGDFVQALNLGFQARDHYRLLQNLDGELAAFRSIGSSYLDLADYEKALYSFKQIEKESITRDLTKSQVIHIPYVWTTMGSCYQGLGHLDTALMYHNKVLDDPNIEFERSPVKALTFRRMADVKVLQGDNAEALSLYRSALATATSKGFTNYLDLGNVYNGIAGIFKNIDQQDSAIYYAELAFQKSQEAKRRLPILESSKLLTSIYREKNQTDSALYYQDIVVALSDSLYGLTKHRELQLLVLQQQEEYQNKLRLEAANKEKIRTITLLSVLLFFFIVSILLYRNYRSKHIAQQKITHSYEKLKSTQAQLIQSEKMASLGELTAGIAHEIQNPLNFVNNFSEVNIELVEELKKELGQVKTQYIAFQQIDLSHIEEAENLMNDIESNQQKITRHGKRADAIVKGMLEHSRTGSGKKELTDINTMTGEYLNLAYQSFKSKNEDIDIELITDFDSSLPKIELVRSEIGKVLLNILNNAFYATSSPFEIQKSPKVILTTKLRAGSPSDAGAGSPLGAGGSGRRWVEIQISDNGNGIPDALKEKIFQPFFTTKPTGQGTGLGLSLAFDIVTKGHGGKLLLSTEGGIGSNFIVELPT